MVSMEIVRVGHSGILRQDKNRTSDQHDSQENTLTVGLQELVFKAHAVSRDCVHVLELFALEVIFFFRQDELVESTMPNLEMGRHN